MPPSTRSELRVWPLGVAFGLLIALWAPSASAQTREVVYVAPIAGTSDIDWRDLAQLRQLFAAELRSTGRVFVIEPAQVEAAVQRSGCSVEDRSCTASVAESLGATIMVHPTVVAVGSGRDAGFLFEIGLTDTAYAWQTHTVSEAGRGSTIWSSFRGPFRALVEAVVDYAAEDSNLRWRSSEMQENALWAGFHIAYVPWGTGTAAVEDTVSGSRAEATYTDDALYGFGVSAAWLWTHVAAGVSVWWFPSAEFELDGRGRGTLRAFDGRGEDSVIGRSGDSTDEVDFNLSLTGLVSLATVFNEGAWTESFFYLTAEGGPVLAVPDGGDDAGLPFGWNGAGELGMEFMGDRWQGFRLGARVQWLQLHQDVDGDTSRLPPRGLLDASVEGLRVMVVVSSLGGG